MFERRIWIAVALFAFAAPLAAKSQERPQEQPPSSEPSAEPAPIVDPVPVATPTLTAPPADPRYAPQPFVMPPPPVPAKEPPLDDLLARAHKKRVAGGVLIGVGLAGTIAGIVISTIAEVNSKGSCGMIHGYDLPGYLCTGQWIGGTVLEAVASLALEAGVVVFIIGGIQKGHALKRAGRVSLAPSISTTGAGARLRFEF